MRAWVSVFVDAADDAVGQSQHIVAEIHEVRHDWDAQLVRYREEQGRTRALRATSTTARILDTLTSTPALTAKTVSNLFGVSTTAALTALDELRAADILTAHSIGRGARAYIADDLLHLLTIAERRLASTRFDTRESPPNRAGPARPPV